MKSESYRRSRKLSALKGHWILAQGKRESVSAPPWVVPRKNLAAVCEDARLSSVALGRVAQMVFILSGFLGSKPIG
jgi:hypothetical protein